MKWRKIYLLAKKVSNNTIIIGNIIAIKKGKIYSKAFKNRDESKEMLLESIDIGTKELDDIIWETILVWTKREIFL